MFYEDFRIGQSADLGRTTFSREAILAYGRRFDPRILARAAEGGAPLDRLGTACGCRGDAAAGRGAQRLARGNGRARRSPAGTGRFARLQRHALAAPGAEGDVVLYSIETISKRETSKPKWGLVGNSFRGVNQRGEEVLVFSSLVLVARRPRRGVISLSDGW